MRDSHFDAEPFNPHAWEELQALVDSFRRHSGVSHAKAGPWPHPTTKRLVELLAVPHQPSEIEAAFAALPRFAWWAEKRHLGLAAISPRVLESLLTEAATGGRQRLSTDELDALFRDSTEVTHATA